jgi:hypothetical protein
LDHPNLVKYYSGWADRKTKTLVLITEQITGDLRNWLVKKIEMAPKVYQRWISQLGGALDYLHKQNWVHADIATSKIFIRGSGELKIGGLAESFFADVHFADKTFQVGIQAPELTEGVRAGPRQNVYQLGLCALQVFTFHHPFRGMSLPQIIKSQMESSFPPELNLIKDRPVLFDLLSRCLEVLPLRITLTEVLKHPYLTDDQSIPPVVPDGVKSPPTERVEVPGAVVLVTGGGGSPKSGPVAAAGGAGGNGAGVAGSGDLVSAVILAPVPVAAVNLPVVSKTASPVQEPPAAVVVRPRTLKCYIGIKDPASPCIRVHTDNITDFTMLKNVVEEDFKEEHLFPDDEWALKYRDSEDDLVMITTRTTLEDIYEFAVHLELHPVVRKIPTNLLGDLLNQSDFLKN